MRERNVFRLSILSIFAFLSLLSLISCVAKKSATKPMLTLTSAPLPQITSTSTNSMIESTPTIFPTLDPDNTYAEMEKLFRDNRCELPCWWGVEPGTTSISDAETKLNGYYEITPSKVIKDGLLLYLSVSISQQEISPQVSVIRIVEQVLREITDGYERVYDEQAYADLLRAYSLTSILNKYGRPSNIFATVEIYNTEPTAPDFMMIWLLYPKNGFIAKYTANAELHNEIVTGCPNKSFFCILAFFTR